MIARILETHDLGLGDLDLEGGTILAPEPQHTPRRDRRIDIGGKPVDLDIALAEQPDRVVAGLAALQLEMLLADDVAVRRVDDLARLGVATEHDALVTVVEFLLLAGQRTVEMLDGDGHRVMPFVRAQANR